ncbi:DUF5133 domain-containing protein [Streptomyces sp. H27-D2]|uniref:DUF5133 domain-containing protein n=1 Tax=Streptomyces sp. H27-D2 TaxID=3046304 RepID=UPI002DBE3462|nr:DUF5133 domain-containing protein [Streptomyces sp. H27-D2]MEC4015477.1 DUF5133 domain-containing protein [Streptomyces sp. H27-D2]
MLKAHPAILRDLVERYERLRTLHREQRSLETRRRLEDITYTLCVLTGTRTIEAALTAAERQLTAALASEAPAATRTTSHIQLTA